MKQSTLDLATSEFAKLCRSASRYGVPVHGAMAQFSEHMRYGATDHAFALWDRIADQRNAARWERFRQVAEIGLAIVLAAGLAYGFLTA